MGVVIDNSRIKRKRKGSKRKNKVVGGSTGRIKLPKNYYNVVRPLRVSNKRAMSSYERAIENPGSNMSVSQSILIPYAGNSAVPMVPYRVPKLRASNNVIAERRHARYLENERRRYYEAHPELNPDEPPPNVNLIMSDIAHDLSQRKDNGRPYSEPYFTHLNPRTGRLISIRPSDIVPDSEEAKAYVKYDPSAAKYLLSSYKNPKVKKVLNVPKSVEQKKDGIPDEIFDEPDDEERHFSEQKDVRSESDDDISSERDVEFEKRFDEREKEKKRVAEVQKNLIDTEAQAFKNIVNLVRTRRENEKAINVLVPSEKPPQLPRVEEKPKKKVNSTLDRFFNIEKRDFRYVNGHKVAVPLTVQFPEALNSIMTPLDNEGRQFIRRKIAEYRFNTRQEPTQKVITGFFNDYKMRTRISDEDFNEQVRLLRSIPRYSAAKAEETFQERYKRNEYHSFDAPILANFYISSSLERLRQEHPEIKFNSAAIRKAEDLESRRYATAISRTNKTRQRFEQNVRDFVDDKKLTMKDPKDKTLSSLSQLDLTELTSSATKESKETFKSKYHDKINSLPGNIGSVGKTRTDRKKEVKFKNRITKGDVVAKKEDITLPMNQETPEDIENATAILEMEAKMHAGNVKDVDLYW